MANDHISRKKAIEEVCGDCEYYDSNDCEECRFDRLMKVPTADVRPVVRGEWIDNLKKHGGVTTICSACGKRSGIGGIESNRYKPFCPNCGADMRPEGRTEK